MNKYHAKKCVVDGIKFDSKKEATRYVLLKDMENRGIISDLELQVKYTLINAQREPSTINSKGKEIPGKLIERECFYKADFRYLKDGKLVVEDTKGMKTPEYIIKRKLMLERYGIRIQEI